MGLKFNNGNGAGICDKCGTMLWVGFLPDVQKLTPFNYYTEGEMHCKECDPYKPIDVNPVKKLEEFTTCLMK